MCYTEVTRASKNLLLIFNTSFTRIKSLEIECSIEFDCPIFLCKFDFIQLLNSWVEFDWNLVPLGLIYYAGTLYSPHTEHLCTYSAFLHVCTSQIEASTSPPPAQPLGIWTFEHWLVQIPSPQDKKAVQMPHQLVLKYMYLSSETNFVFNQTLFTLLRERYAVMTPFWKSYSLTKVKFYLVNPSNQAKTKKISQAHYTRTRDKFGSNSPLPGHDAWCTVKCLGYAQEGGGGDVKALIWLVH